MSSNHPDLSSLIFLRLLLLVTVFFSFFFNIHAIPLFDLDEGAFSEATREMFVRGDFISTYLDGKPRYDKPILIYWLQALSVLLFGVNELAFRLPSAVAASLWVLAVYAFTRRTVDEHTGLVAALITAAALEVSVMASAATADALLNLWIACSMFTIFLYWREQQKRWLYLSYIFIGLGFLTKGPVAILIPLVVSFLFFAIRGEWKTWIQSIFNPLGIALFISIAAPWYVIQYIKEGDAFIQGFFFKHNIERFQSPMESHGGSLLYYIPVVLVAVLPFTSLLIKSLVRYKSITKEDLRLYSLLWFGFVLLFFSLSGTKLPHYVLYGLTGLFILMALNLMAISHSTYQTRFWLFLPALLWFLFLLLLPESIDYIKPLIKDTFAQAMLTDHQNYFSLNYRLFFLSAVMLSVYWIVDRRFSVKNKLLLTGLVSVIGLSMFLLPVVGDIQQGPIKQAAAIAKQEGYEVIRWKLNTPSFSVYTQQITENRHPQAGDIVLTKIKYLNKLGEYQTLYQRGGIAMVKVVQ